MSNPEIPVPQSTATVLHADTERTIIIHQVAPERGTMWRILAEPLDDVFKNGDPVFWIDGAKRHPTFVRELQRHGTAVRFILVAGSGW